MNLQLEQAARALDNIRAARGRRAFRVPGRIEVLGKHTDYAGGRSLLCAVERGFVVVVAPRRDTIVRVVKADHERASKPVASDTFELDLSHATSNDRHDWTRYAATVVHRIAQDFPAARHGADIAFASDLPPASGLSSSSGLVVALFLAIDAVNELSREPRYRDAIPGKEALADYLGAVENGRSFGALHAGAGVGTLGGSQDHTAILCCQDGMLSRYSFCPVRAEGTIPMPRERQFVIAFSGLAAPKSEGARSQYNEASLAVGEIVRLWNAATHRTDATLADAAASAPDAPKHLRSVIAATQPDGFSVQRLSNRLEQFLAESLEIIPHASAALQRNDLGAFGAQVDASQANVERWLGNQTPETIALARSARELGADAASAFGAGFGGSVWAMVHEDVATSFTAKWRERYKAGFPDAARDSTFFTTGACDGASEISMENAPR